MAVRLGTIVLGAEDVEPTVEFWAAAMGYEPVRFPNSENQFTILVPPDRIGTRIGVQLSQTPAQDRPRIHLDLVVDTPDEQSSEVARLVSLGAREVDWEYSSDSDFIVLADPAGNRFCIVDASA